MLIFNKNKKIKIIKMTPKILNEDCFIFLSSLENESIDSVITDPPYGMNFVSGRRKEKYNKIKNDEKENLNEWLDLFVDEIYRVLKNNTASFVFCSWHNIDIFKQALEKKFKIKNILVWVKNNHGSGDLKGAFAPKHEFIIHIQKGRKILEGKREPDVLYFNKTGNEYHPTQKPVDLIEYLIEKSTKENEMVLDPFLGSGTTAIACKNKNRKIYGCELDKDYFNVIMERLKN